MIEIPLTQGKVTQVDDDFEFLNQYNWYASKAQSKASFQYYALRKSARLNGIQLTIQLHRVIMETKLGRHLLRTEEIDHIDHDGLNNTCNNLRIVSHTQNNRNRRKQGNKASSEYKGISWHKNESKWIAHIGKDGKLHHIGYFISEEDAARAYDAAAKKLFGPYANLNFPSED